MNRIYHPPNGPSPSPHITGDDLVTAALEFDKLRNQISDGSLLPPGEYAAVLSHFGYVSQNELALTLMLADTLGGGGGPIPDPLTLGTFIATSQVQVPNGLPTALALQIGTGNYGLYRTGTSIIVYMGGIAALTIAPGVITLGATLSGGNQFRASNFLQPINGTELTNKDYVDAAIARVNGWMQATSDLPPTQPNGTCWYNTTTNEFKGIKGGAVVTFTTA